MAKNKSNSNAIVDQNKIKFGLYVKKHRELKGYTQQELADLIGLTPKSISFIERGVNYPSQEHIFKLAELLEMSLDEFVFSYSRFNKTISIQEINDMLEGLTPDDQGIIISMLKGACESMLKRK